MAGSPDLRSVVDRIGLRSRILNGGADTPAPTSLAPAWSITDSRPSTPRSTA
ncbi:hypothetical protein [Streptomyces sp. NPDC058441]|uniref:hypothetical protein n=1 Tax=Streptomyces sp. NPDC058441 TaxID=3346502 RepID=UPI00365F9A60